MLDSLLLPGDLSFLASLSMAFAKEGESPGIKPAKPASMGLASPKLGNVPKGIPIGILPKPDIRPKPGNADMLAAREAALYGLSESKEEDRSRSLGRPRRRSEDGVLTRDDKLFGKLACKTGQEYVYNMEVVTELFKGVLRYSNNVNSYLGFDNICPFWIYIILRILF